MMIVTLTDRVVPQEVCMYAKLVKYFQRAAPSRGTRQEILFCTPTFDASLFGAYERLGRKRGKLGKLEKLGNL